MPIMPSTHYLPSEELNFRNYPEVGQQWVNIQTILAFGKTVQIALDKYNNSQANRVDVNMQELRNTVDLTRQVCDVLGRAPNVCFDLLVEIRMVWVILNQIIDLQNRFGSQYVGVSTVATTGGGI